MRVNVREFDEALNYFESLHCRFDKCLLRFFGGNYRSIVLHGARKEAGFGVSPPLGEVKLLQSKNHRGG